MPDVVARGFVLRGRVQGVGFRWWTRREAERLGVGGTVRNRSDGTVEVQLRGPEDAVVRLTAWLEKGPPAARVDEVTPVEPAPGTPDHQFRVLG